MPPVIDTARCTACGVCTEICPSDVFWGSEAKKTPEISYPEECWHCYACVLDCPVEGAIRLRIPMPLHIVYKKGAD